MEPLHVGLAILALVAAIILIVLLARHRARARTHLALPPAPPVDGRAEAEIEPMKEPALEVEAESTEEPVPEARLEPGPEPGPEPEPAAEKESALDRILSIRKGLKATRGGFVSRLRGLFATRAELSDDLTEQIEEVLITSDVGTHTAAVFIQRLRQDLPGADLNDPRKVWAFVRQEARQMLAVESKPAPRPAGAPLAILVLGVNGVGKTTTIGKLAAHFSAQGQKVLLGAADTFRAAAVEQLEVWGGRIGCPVIKGKEGADPSSVVFDALKTAREDNMDVVIVDTAGRLHTKAPLMEELKKIRRVMDKAQPGAPHEVYLVLDATTGQNGVAQAKTFLESLDVTGIVLTKLDGTAKGGVILGIVNELKIPVRYIGVGEGIEDLRPFDADEFVAALFDDVDGEEAAA